MGARPLLPCEGSNEPCTRLSISRRLGQVAALNREVMRRVHENRLAPRCEIAPERALGAGRRWYQAFATSEAARAITLEMAAVAQEELKGEPRLMNDKDTSAGPCA